MEALRGERADDKQDGGGARRAGLEDLHLVEDEVLAEHRHGNAPGDQAKIAERAAEERAVRQHGDRRGAGGGIARRERDRVEIFADRSDAGRSALYLRNDGHLGSGQRALERLRRGSRGGLALESGSPPMERGELPARGVQNLFERNRHLVLRPVFG